MRHLQLQVFSDDHFCNKCCVIKCKPNKQETSYLHHRQFWLKTKSFLFFLSHIQQIHLCMFDLHLRPQIQRSSCYIEGLGTLRNGLKLQEWSYCRDLFAESVYCTKKVIVSQTESRNLNTENALLLPRKSSQRDWRRCNAEVYINSIVDQPLCLVSSSSVNIQILNDVRIDINDAVVDALSRSLDTSSPQLHFLAGTMCFRQKNSEHCRVA